MRYVQLRRQALVVVLAALAALAAASSASAATSSVVWGAGPIFNSGAALTAFTSISCSSPGNCVAVGYAESSLSGGTDSGIVAAEANGSWGPASTLPVPSTPTPDSGAASEANSVSCSSATACVAVGDYENSNFGQAAVITPITVSGSTTTPGTPTVVTLPAAPGATDPAADDSTNGQNAALNGVSCTSGGCTAVGTYTDKSGNTWPMIVTDPVGGAPAAATEVDAAKLPTGQEDNATLTAISCPASGACEAVGYYGKDNSGTEDAYPMAVQITDGAADAAKPVTLPSDSVAQDYTSLGTTFIPGAGNNLLNAISCPSAGVCTAAGAYANAASGSTPFGGVEVAVPITTGTPGTAVAIPSGNTGTVGFSIGTISGIWCADAGDCNVVGYYYTGSALSPLTGAEAGGTWAPLTTQPSPGSATLGLLLGVACTDINHCVAPGIAESIATETAQAYFEVSAPALTSTTPTLPSATVGQPYSATLTATGGSGMGNWSVPNGSLPAGLSLNAATGEISGTPSTAGQTTLTATDTDAGPPAQTATAQVTIVVNAAATTTTTTTTTPPPAAKVGIAHVSTKGQKATVVLLCTGASCAGTVKLTAIEHLKGTTPTSVSPQVVTKKKKKKAKQKTKTVTLASTHYAIGAEASQTITLTLRGKAAKLLTTLKKLGAELTITPTGQTTPAATKAVRFTATKPKPKKPKHRKK